MYIRCVACRSATWIGTGSSPSGDPLSCSGCGQEHRPRPQALAGATGKDGYRRARELARSEGIDVPAAYSVLLGLMSARQARGEPDDTPAGSENAPGESPPHEDGSTDGSDEARERARWLVSTRRSATGNRLGAGARREAAVRGNGAAIRKLTERYGLRAELAREIVERRITLQQALQEHAADATPGRPADDRRGRKRGGMRLLAAASLLLAAAAATGYWGWSRWQDYVAAARAMDAPPPAAAGETRPARPAPPDPMGRVEVSHGDEGAIREVRGPNPALVLEGYCTALRPVPCEPIELAATDPPHHEARWGIFRDFGNLSGFRAMRIHRERSSREWVVGDGRRPVPTFEASSIRLGEPRVDLWSDRRQGAVADGPPADPTSDDPLADVLPADLRDRRP